MKMVNQYWLLFHDTKPELNFISLIPRTELINHVQIHVVSADDYNVLQSENENLKKEIEHLEYQLQVEGEL